MGDFNFKGVLLLAAILAGVGFSVKVLKQPKVATEESFDEETSNRKTVKRRPASASVIPDYKQGAAAPRASQFSFSNSDQSTPFNRTSEFDSQSGIGDTTPVSVSSAGAGYVSSGPSHSRSRSYASSDGDSKSIKGQGNDSAIDSNSSSTPYVISGPISYTTSGSRSGDSDSDDDDDIDDDNDDNPVSNDALTCSSNIGGGAYGNPIEVNLTCSATADIKFCIQEGSCCDPETSGISYSSPIVIGAQGGTYCLSFYGQTSASKVSSTVNHSYVINNTYPDIQVAFPKIFYQTTQLPALHMLRSNEFSKTNYQIGEINLKSHDPGPSGLDMSCEDIVQNYVSLSSPTPVAVFNPLDISGVLSGQQMNIPMELDKLAYGDNFLTSYLINYNFPAPLYSCSTNKVTLQDFDFFTLEVTHGVAGTNAGREFSGSVVSYGFFEEAIQTGRVPAGSALEAQNEQELRTGSFGVFY